MKIYVLNLFAVAVLAAVVLLSACKKEEEEPSYPKPVAKFTFETERKYVPTQVEFTNESSEASSYEWDFGDGSATTIEENPTHMYHKAGVYTVKLTAEGKGGSSSASQTIEVFDPPNQLEIRNIKLENYTITDPNGEIWDPNDGPDIFCIIADEEMNTAYYISELMENVDYNDLPFIFEEDLPFLITDLDETLTITFWDNDAENAAFMGGFYFTPSSSTEASTYPTEIGFYAGANFLKFKIEVQWKTVEEKSVLNHQNSNSGKNNIPVQCSEFPVFK